MISIVRKNLSSSLFSSPNFSFLCNPNLLSIHHFSTPKSNLRRRLKKTPSPGIYDVLFHKHHFPPEFASSLASAHLTKYATPERADSVLSFLKENSFTNSQLEKIVGYKPLILGYNVELLQLKLSVFRDLGLSSEEVAKMMVDNATILQLSLPNRIIPSLSILKGLLGSNDELARLLRRSGWFVAKDMHKTLMPNVQILKSSGMPMERVRHFLFVFPRAFLIKPDVMRKSIDKAIEFGVTRTSISFMVAVQIFSYMSQEMLEVKMQFFRDLGFSDAEVLSMIRRQPTILSISQKKLKSVVELLVGTGKYTTSNIVADPSSLGRSIEKRLEPRLQVLVILESRKLIEKWPGLPTVCALTDARFYDRFVRPYREGVGEAFDNMDYLNKLDSNHVLENLKSISLGKSN